MTASPGPTESNGGRTAAPRWYRVRILTVLIATSIAVAVLALAFWAYCLRMPGRSYDGEIRRAGSALSRALEADVRRLCGEFGARNGSNPAVYAAAAAWIERRFREAGVADVAVHAYDVGLARYANVEAIVRGTDLASEIVVVGAHYDAVAGTVGANDNASGVAALLALAERVAGSSLRRTLRFVAFANEEPPHFQTDAMGSLVYARGCRDRGERVVAMLSFDGIGFYDDAEGSQHYPDGLAVAFPSRADFVALVGDLGSRALVRRAIETFRAHATIPSEGAALPADLPGVGWSDHWSFWQAGYPALEITDTLPFRYAHYHTAGDTPEKLDYERMARVVEGVEAVVRDLASG